MTDTAACGAEWTTEHDDSYYGLSACCDQQGTHDKHSGPVTTWDGDHKAQPEGVRLEWPST